MSDILSNTAAMNTTKDFMRPEHGGTLGRKSIRDTVAMEPSSQHFARGELAATRRLRESQALAMTRLAKPEVVKVLPDTEICSLKGNSRYHMMTDPQKRWHEFKENRKERLWNDKEPRRITPVYLNSEDAKSLSGNQLSDRDAQVGRYLNYETRSVASYKSSEDDFSSRSPWGTNNNRSTLNEPENGFGTKVPTRIKTTKFQPHTVSQLELGDGLEHNLANLRSKMYNTDKQGHACNAANLGKATIHTDENVLKKVELQSQFQGAFGASTAALAAKATAKPKPLIGYAQQQRFGNESTIPTMPVDTKSTRIQRQEREISALKKQIAELSENR